MGARKSENSIALASRLSGFCLNRKCEGQATSVTPRHLWVTEPQGDRLGVSCKDASLTHGRKRDEVLTKNQQDIYAVYSLGFGC